MLMSTAHQGCRWRKHTHNPAGVWSTGVLLLSWAILPACNQPPPSHSLSLYCPPLHSLLSLPSIALVPSLLFTPPHSLSLYPSPLSPSPISLSLSSLSLSPSLSLYPCPIPLLSLSIPLSRKLQGCCSLFEESSCHSTLDLRPSSLSISASLLFSPTDLSHPP